MKHGTSKQALRKSLHRAVANSEKLKTRCWQVVAEAVRAEGQKDRKVDSGICT